MNRDTTIERVTLLAGEVSEQGGDLALALAEQGSHIAMIYFNEAHETVEKIRQEVEALGYDCLAIPLPQPNRQRARWAVQTVVETFGRLDSFITFPLISRPARVSPGSLNGQSRKFVRELFFPGYHVMVAALQVITLGQPL
ncbi:MAG: hypothetical protein L0332_17020 [Chloroflexi bacterium]|nr:hypothetical protein [Chloroflexota bacterium]MCI0644941.1 hypothetical protein [Chloroflexota bacterium]MCI0728402.1 hypothetical protein [Chloroflexota bacterium]